MVALANSLALLRFGHFHFLRLGGHGGGASGFLLLAGLAFAGVLIWAITRPARNASTNS
jgi:hypothetical protein